MWGMARPRSHCGPPSNRCRPASRWGASFPQPFSPSNTGARSASGAPTIPRTLHVSLTGLRDLTLLETPPKDRSRVLTFIERWDDGLIEEALARELDRGGQVYFVHNRIETIDTIVERVRALAPPRARIAVAHGKLKEAELDAVMARFVRGEVDILVSTMRSEEHTSE